MNAQITTVKDFDSAYSIAHAACEEARRLAAYAKARGDVSMSEADINAMYECIMESLGYPDPDELPAPTVPGCKARLRLVYSRP